MNAIFSQLQNIPLCSYMVERTCIAANNWFYGKKKSIGSQPEPIRKKHIINFQY